MGGGSVGGRPSGRRGRRALARGSRRRARAPRAASRRPAEGAERVGEVVGDGATTARPATRAALRDRTTARAPQRAVGAGRGSPSRRVGAAEAATREHERAVAGDDGAPAGGGEHRAEQEPPSARIDAVSGNYGASPGAASSGPRGGPEAWSRKERGIAGAEERRSRRRTISAEEDASPRRQRQSVGVRRRSDRGASEGVVRARRQGRLVTSVSPKSVGAEKLLRSCRLWLPNAVDAGTSCGAAGGPVRRARNSKRSVQGARAHQFPVVWARSTRPPAETWTGTWR